MQALQKVFSLVTFLFFCARLSAAPISIPFSGTVDNLDSAIDLAGNIYIVGEVGTGSSATIEARIYTTNQTWASSTLSSPGGHQPAVIASYGGNCMAAWLQENGTYFDVYASYYNGSTWSTAVKISSNLIENSSTPLLKFFGKSILALWKVNNASASDCFIESNIHSSSMWGTSARSVNIGMEIVALDAGTDSYGNILICYDADPATPISAITYNIQANLWGIPEVYLGKGGVNSTNVSVGDPKAYGCVAWLLELDNQYFVQYSSYSIPLVVNNYLEFSIDNFASNSNFDLRTVTTGKSGLLLWEREDGGVSNIYGASIDLSSGHLNSIQLLATSDPGILHIQLEANEAGQGVGVWKTNGATQILQRSVYTSSTQWGSIESIYSTTSNIENLSTAVTDYGINSIVWTENGSAYLLKELLKFQKVRKKPSNRRKSNLNWK